MTTEKIGRLALVALAALLPFEWTQPLVTLGPLAITSLELVLYLALIAWAVSRVAARRIRWTRVHGAVIAWAAVMILSAVVAPTHQAEAFKFALRSLSACALFFAAADLAAEPQHAVAMMTALAAGAAVSALAALAEVTVPGASAALMAFKTQPSVVGSFVRASGTFQYANIGAMYWEAAVPIVLAAGIYQSIRGNETRRQWIAAASAIMLIEAILLSVSRAALIGAGLALAILLVIGPRAVRAGRAPAAISLLGLAALTAVNMITSPLLALRMRTENDSGWYRAEYHVNAPPAQIQASQTITISITVRNTGAIPWPASGDQPVHLSYHWHDRSTGQTAVYEGARTALPGDVQPEEEATLEAHVAAPGAPGSYRLQWDMVHEHVTWFSARGASTGDVPLQITSAPDGSSTAAMSPAPPIVIMSQPARLDLWRAGIEMWLAHPLFGVGPDNFRHLYGAYLGLPASDTRIHANSLYVETLADVGLAGILALIALIVTLIAEARRALPGTRRLLVLGLLAALATFLAHGAVDYFFEFTPTVALFWLCAGTCVGLCQVIRAHEREPDRV